MASERPTAAALSEPNPAKSPPPRDRTHPLLSCTHCRQRKVKCDKVFPCVHCRRAGLVCVVPERAKNAKKKKHGAKASNDELMRRINHLEDLIGKAEGKALKEHGVKENGASQMDQSQEGGENECSKPVASCAAPDNDEDRADDTLNRYLGDNFLRSLTTEIEGLKQSLDDDTDDEEQQYSSPSVRSPDSQTTGSSTTLLGSTLSAPRDLRLLHPPPMHIQMLCNLYISNIDPLFKVLHVPTLRKMVSDVVANMDNIPTGDYVEALLFAMYYAAITSLTKQECLQQFHDSKETLLAKYFAGTERALSNANLLNDFDLGTLQALAILLLTVRANDNSLYGWTMFATAVRIAQALGLHREGSRSGLSPFETEMRRRVWWCLIVLDVRCSEDITTDPIILEPIFNTKKPANINDSDLDPLSTEPIVERVGWTEMTKPRLSHDIARLLWQITYRPPVKAGETPTPVTVDRKIAILGEVERYVSTHILAHCDLSIPIAWTTATVAQIIVRRLRLAVHHPLQYGSLPSERPRASREMLLTTAVECLEMTHLLDSEPMAKQWRWFFRTYVQWHALAAVLAELCIQRSGGLFERAWRIVDVVFDDCADRIADSPNGRLWRPIRKLKAKAQSVKNQHHATTTKSSQSKGDRGKEQGASAFADLASKDISIHQQLPLPYFGTFGPPSTAIPFIESMVQDPLVSDPSAYDTLQAPTLPNLQSSSTFPSSLPNSHSKDTIMTNDLAALGLGGSGSENDLSNGNTSGANMDMNMNINWAEWDNFMQEYQMDFLNAFENPATGTDDTVDATPGVVRNGVPDGVVSNIWG